MRLRLQLAALFIVLFSVANAQTKLTGKVVNGKNEPVAGVSIKIVGAQGGTTSDVEGRYSLSLTANKKYELEFSAIGYVSKLVNDIEVGAGLDNELNIVLEIAAKNIEGVVVKATSRRQENTAALLSFQKNNIALSSGLASDFIRRTPDKNTGEVLKRVSGASIQDNRFVIIRGLSDRYNAAIINNAQFPSTEPDKKAFSFDVIPSALIDNIIINKTASPDLTGEFAGGLVQINTKDVPTKNFLSVGVSFGFNTQSAFKDFISNERNSTDWMGFDNGDRALPKGFPKTAQAYRSLGASTAGVQQQIELSKLFSNTGYAEKKSTALPTQSYSLTWGNSARTKNGGTFGTILSLQYRNSMLKYNVARELHQDDGELLVQLNDEQNKYSVNVGALANFTYVKGRHKISFKNLFNQLLEDNYYTRRGVSNDRLQDIEFRSSVLNQRSLYSGQLEGEHQLTNNGIRLRWNGNFAYNSKSQPDLRTSAYFRSKGTTDPFEQNDDDTRRFFSELKDFSYGANGSLSIPFTLGSDKQTLKVGGSTLIRVRDFKSRIFRYEPANASQFDASKNLLPYDQIFAAENMGMDGFKILDFTNNQDKYFAASANNGMYGMFDNKFGDMFRLVWGVRVENFQQFLTTKDVSAKRVVVETEKWDVLPSFNFTFSPTTKQSIRLSGSRTVARPEFREIAPFSFFDYEVNYAVNGNPDLKRSAILNGDIRYEWYPKGGEAITIGGFYKHFDDPIELRLNPSSVLDRRNYEYANANSAYTVGAEFEVRKGLDFISQHLDAFNIFANLTYIYSKVTLASTGATGTTTSNRPLQGQSPYLVNAGLQYNSKNTIWNGSLLYNRVGQRLALVGINDLGFPDIYERPRNQVDFQLAKKVFNKKGEVKITWADLLNPAFYFYENVDKKKAFSDGTDRLFNSYKPGSTITVGLTYDFNLGSKK
ncbi:TonB-dependent receptor [Terrimonas alba]|uniref:TonB-dependent receptor n=1 Tax=Terrimonas alba TaxID=3349636 RepID=UPI0035F2DDBE